MFVCASVRQLREVTKNDLTSSLIFLCFWLLSIGCHKDRVSVGTIHGTIHGLNSEQNLQKQVTLKTYFDEAVVSSKAGFTSRYLLGELHNMMICHLNTSILLE